MHLPLAPSFHPPSSCATRLHLTCVIDYIPAYTVCQILDILRHGRDLQFLVDLEGDGLGEQSWIPRHHILDKDLLRDFSKDHPDKLGRSPGCDRL